MAETAISVAILLIEKIISFSQKQLEHTNFGDINAFKTKLMTMQSCLKDAEAAEVGGEIMSDLIKQIRNVAHEIEDVLDELMLQAPRQFSNYRAIQEMYMVGHNAMHWMSVQDIQSKMLDIRGKVDAIINSSVLRELLKYCFKSQGVGMGSPQAHHHSPTPRVLEDDDILGIEEPKSRLIDQLLSRKQMRGRVAIAVVGPAGAGKTVLVNNVYRSKKVRGHFTCSAWISVSSSSSSSSSSYARVNTELSRSLFVQFYIGRDELLIPLSMLRSNLQGRRYIVVLDDILTVQQWESIQSELPNEEPHDSRILVTTKNNGVADSCVTSTDHIHQIDGLAWKDAWNLFCKKAFRTNNGKCPLELVDVAQKIVKKCEHLPLSIAAVGSMLSRKRPIPSEWEKVHNNLGLEMETNSTTFDTISNMLLPSYKDLPSNVKSCFLYFSIFPEDYSIARGRLIRLWVAEGFIKEALTGRKKLEEIAEDYLNELIERNLVHACSRDLDGRVKRCRVLNLVREFAIMKSSEENFAVVLTQPDHHQPLCQRARRLSVHNVDFGRIREITYLNYIRNLSVFGPRQSISRIKETWDKFKLLRVLDLQNAHLNNHFPSSICQLLLLRYLSMRHTNVAEIPTYIEDLHYLEYLDLKHTHVSKLPKGICNLHRLRHLLVYCHNIQGVMVLGAIGALKSLQMLTLIRAYNKGQKFFQELGNLRQLEKLGLIDLHTTNGKFLCESLQKMENLSFLDLRSSTDEEEFLDLDYMDNLSSSNLQRLYLKGCLQKLPRWINLSLSSLIRVHLKCSKLDDSPIEILKNLPNLMELHMVDAFIGGALIFEDRGFPKLKILLIEGFCCLDTIKVCQGAMPKLRKLTFVKCIKLWKLPVGIEHLTSLEELLLYHMSPHLTNKLQKGSRERLMVNHIAVIRAFSLGASGCWETVKGVS